MQMIEKLVQQARAILLFEENSSTFILKEAGEVSIKQIDLPSLLKSIQQTDYQSDWYLSNLKLLKICQQREKTLTISSLPPSIYELKIDDDRLRLPLPGVIIVHCDRQLWLYAYKGRDLSLSSPLYNYPLPNISSTGQVCWGKVLPETNSPEAIWSSYINSKFNQDYQDKKSKAFPHNIIKQLQTVSQSLNIAYPEQDLIASNQTLKDLTQLIDY
jgi:hypothetical protein